MQRIAKFIIALSFICFQSTYTTKPTARYLSMSFKTYGNRNQLDEAFIWLHHSPNLGPDRELIYLNNFFHNRVAIDIIRSSMRIEKEFKDPAFMNKVQSILSSIPPATFAQQFNQTAPNEWDLLPGYIQVTPGTWQEKMHNLATEEITAAQTGLLPKWSQLDDFKSVLGWYKLKNMALNLYKKITRIPSKRV